MNITVDDIICSLCDDHAIETQHHLSLNVNGLKDSLQQWIMGWSAVFIGECQTCVESNQKEALEAN